MTTLSAVAEAFRPADLEVRGAALWSGMGGDVIADPARAVVLAETCRMADTLDRLDGLIRGDETTWASIEIPDADGKELKLVLHTAISERRQTATVFRHLIAQLTNVAPVAVSEPAPDAAREKTVDEIAEQRDRRRAAAADS